MFRFAASAAVAILQENKPLLLRKTYSLFGFLIKEDHMCIKVTLSRDNLNTKQDLDFVFVFAVEEGL